MPEFCCDHLFRTTVSAAKFEAMVAKACRDAFAIELTAHDPGVIPELRLFTVGFSTPEDRDRMRIAMRFVEKELGIAEAPMSAMLGKQLASA